MTSDELRALADALEPMAKAPRFEDFDVPAFCAWVRAQADAQPVPAVPAGWKVVPVEPTQAMNNAGLSAVNQYGKRSVWETYAAMLAAAPAAPQAEPKREPLSDEQITKGEYVLATKFSDGDPGDHWGVGFYDRFENGRHYVIDIAGKQIRGNGFRRAGRITADVGRWLLSAAKSLEASPPGTVNLWTMLTERAYGIGDSNAE